MKKAQIQSQIFVYILTMLVVGLILLYGYNAIKGFKQKQEDVTMIEVENQLKTLITSASSKYGSIEKAELNLPSAYEKICFADNTKLGPTSRLDCGLSGQPKTIVVDSIKSSTANIFLVPDGSKNFKIGKIIVDNGCVCIGRTGSQTVFRIEGMGNGVKISSW
jgi:hypothetical protein